MQILAPCAGRAVPMTEVPDPVFAAQTVGPGVGVEPGGGKQTVVSPVAGLLLKASPHAFIVLVDGETGILVHIGIDTVRLNGEGFEVLAQQGATVQAGTPVVTWDPEAVAGRGLATTVVVVVMDAPPDSIRDAAAGPVAAGDPLFVA